MLDVGKSHNAGIGKNGRGQLKRDAMLSFIQGRLRGVPIERESDAAVHNPIVRQILASAPSHWSPSAALRGSFHHKRHQDKGSDLVLMFQGSRISKTFQRP
jgi:hypothetical protein